MGETLNHPKEEQGLTHNDTVLFAIFVAVRSYLTPLPYGVIPRIRNPIDLLGRRGGQLKMGGEQRPWKRWEGWAQQEGLWKGTPCKHRLLFQGLDESCDPSGISDETVGVLFVIVPTGAREYTEDIFSCWTLTYTYVHCFILWKMLHFLLKYPHQAGFFFVRMVRKVIAVITGNVVTSYCRWDSLM